MIKRRFLNIFISILMICSPGMTGALAQDTVRFNEGLMISGSGVLDRSAFTSDPVTWALINGTFSKPEEGSVFSTGPGGREIKWEKITRGDDGYFSNRGLRGGLYLEYESPAAKTMLLEVSGNTLSVVNGVPLEGDHYDFGYSVRPVKLKKGTNTLWLTAGRFPRIKVTLIAPEKPVMLTSKDLTLPDLVKEEPDILRYGAVQVINTGGKDLAGYSLSCSMNGKTEISPLPVLSRENTRKLPFLIPASGTVNGGETKADLILKGPSGKEVDRITITLKNKQFAGVHDRTFISAIDGSVQYFSVNPGGTNAPGEGLFLSVHGAGVEARNQARAYKPKDWGDVVAATNRRPYGFSWEDWGRLDALEVLSEGKKLFNPDPSKIYLTGHSMGGHGTWYLGATYPALFAAIGPCAGYADLLNYASGQGSRPVSASAAMMLRAGNPTRTKSLARNYLHQGVYVFHGDADETVPVEQARDMRALLGTFHPDFTYKEYPGGSHWFSDQALDWPPIFDFFRLHSIPAHRDVIKIEFYTANPGISATSHWLTLAQQTKPLMISNVNVKIDTAKNSVSVTTGNVARFSLDLSSMNVTLPVVLTVDSASVIEIAEKPDSGILWLAFSGNGWKTGKAPAASEKNPLRNGTFKDAYRNNMVFVYGTGGTAAENEWMYARARLDAATFGYRGNGSIEMVPDRSFDPAAYPDRNVILFGNAAGNSAWNKLLVNCPVEAGKGFIKIGDRMIEGDDLACFFVWPRAGSTVASVGVVGGSGLKGMKGGYGNQYFNSGSAFPDLTVVRSDAGIKGYDAVICTGFFSNGWQVDGGDILWNEK
jgi:pimeloyl-ACP methyl ester carboxylesterase